MKKTETWWGILCDQWDGVDELIWDWVDELVADEDLAVERAYKLIATRFGFPAGSKSDLRAALELLTEEVVLNRFDANEVRRLLQEEKESDG